MNTIINFAYRFRWLIIAAFLALSIFFALHARNLTPDNDVRSLYPAQSRVNEIAEQVQETFGHHERLLLVLAGDMTQGSTMESLRAVANDLADLSTVHGVTSIASARNISRGALVPRVEPLLPDGTISNEAAVEALAVLDTSPLYEGMALVATAHDYATVIIEMVPGSDAVALARDARAVVESIWQDDYAFAGQAFTSLELQNIIGRDLPVLGALALAAIMVMLFVNFRTLHGALLPLTQIIVGVVWGMGIFELFGGKLMALSVIGPIAVMAVASSFVINMLGRYYFELAAGAEPVDAIARMLKETGLGVIISGLAIAAAMSTFTLSGLQMVQGLGIIAAIGVLAALLSSLLLLPALLHVLPAPRRARVTQREGALAKLLTWLGSFVQRGRKGILLVVLAVFLLAGFGLLRIEFNTSIMAFFPEDGPTRQSVRSVEHVLGGSANITALIQADFTDPDAIARLAQFQAEAAALDNMGAGQSIVNILRNINLVLNGEDSLPSTASDLQRTFLLMRGAGPEAARFITPEHDQAVVQFVATAMPTTRTAALQEELATLATEVFGPDVPVAFAGNPLLELEIADTMQRDFILSLSLAIILVLIIDSFVRSFRAALVTILVLLITIVLQYGLLGWLGIPLNLATMLMGALAIGVGDYAIHLTVRYMEERREHEPEPAMARSLTSAGRQVLFTALTLGAGFGALTFATFVPVATLGSLMLVTVALVGITTLTVLPAAALTYLREPFRKRKKR